MEQQVTERKVGAKQCDTQRTAKELIDLLQKAVAQNGDLPVRFVMQESSDKVYGDSHPVVGFVAMMEDDKPDYFLLGNDEMLDSMN